MLTVSRDDPQYPWHRRPADHSVAGLFIGGPQPAANPLATLIAPSRTAEKPEGPVGAKQRMRREKVQKLALLERQRRFLAAVQGERVAPSRRFGPLGRLSLRSA